MSSLPKFRRKWAYKAVNSKGKMRIASGSLAFMTEAWARFSYWIFFPLTGNISKWKSASLTIPFVCTMPSSLSRCMWLILLPVFRKRAANSLYIGCILRPDKNCSDVETKRLLSASEDALFEITHRMHCAQEREENTWKQAVPKQTWICSTLTTTLIIRVKYALTIFNFF